MSSRQYQRSSFPLVSPFYVPADYGEARMAAIGWLSADGFVLWGPVTAMLAVCLARTHSPLPVR